MNKEKLNEIRQDIDAALAKIAQKHGFKEMSFGTIRYDNDGFRTSIEARLEGAETADFKALRMSAKYLGFSEKILNANIDYANKKCKVIGMKRTKLILVIDGKECVAPIQQVKESLIKQKSDLVIV